MSNRLRRVVRGSVNFAIGIITNEGNGTAIWLFFDPSINTVAKLQSAYPDLEVYHVLNTPVTENCGYVDLPDIPSDATVSIPELEDLGLTFWVDGDGTIRAAMREWYERAHSEYADRLTALEEAVAEIVAG